jgi:pimeloyl-ACP methyl ester carboxylesterase
MFRTTPMTTLTLLIVIAATALLLHSQFATADDTTPKKKLTFVIVHGAYGGGWSWKQVDDLLTADGNTVYRPTLTGLGERSHLASPDIGLDTHITDIVDFIRFENLHDVVLVGHSYGGMVITGVAQQVPDRLSRLIYLDALLPNDGDSVNTLFPKEKRVVKDGFIMPTWKLPAEPPHDVPQPAKTFSDTISVKNPDSAKLLADYILFVAPDTKLEDAHFYPFYQRAAARSWPTFTLSSDHNAWRSHPKELVELLEKITADDAH